MCQNKIKQEALTVSIIAIIPYTLDVASKQIKHLPFNKAG